MFKTTPATEPAPVAMDTSDLVPLSVLELDLPAPTTGWLIELDRRCISVVLDDVGRRSISRADARQLLTERREAEARKREVVERNEQQAIEADRLRRASIWGGIPATALPDGLSAASAMLAAAPGRPPAATVAAAACVGQRGRVGLPPHPG